MGGCLIGICIAAFQAMPHLDPSLAPGAGDRLPGRADHHFLVFGRVVVFLMDATAWRRSRPRLAVLGSLLMTVLGLKSAMPPIARQRPLNRPPPALCRSGAVEPKPRLPQAAGIGYNRPWLP